MSSMMKATQPTYRTLRSEMDRLFDEFFDFRRIGLPKEGEGGYIPRL